MTHLARVSLPLLAGAALSVLAACGPGTPPPAPGPVEADAALPAEVSAEDSHDVHAEDHAEGEVHDHEEGEDHDHDHAGGAAHVHGIADLAFVIEGSKLTAELVSPLANFGLSEADGVFTPEVIAALPGFITLTGGNCTAETPAAEVDTSSGHADGHVNFTWTCANAGGVTAARFAGFSAFPGFEKVNAVFVTDTAQKAAELTPSSPELSLK
ncbi:ZrgA family zinc uptake protein [Hyphomonas sp. NPDC076900]|uniref:ZrgA family zinc uptake protein n=1 Tax=unclassified Hyphomonas TaxID=2630699 RepID=UPI003D05A3D0